MQRNPSSDHHLGSLVIPRPIQEKKKLERSKRLTVPPKTSQVRLLNGEL
jgi:hypothetical protein